MGLTTYSGADSTYSGADSTYCGIGSTYSAADSTYSGTDSTYTESFIYVFLFLFFNNTACNLICVA